MKARYEPVLKNFSQPNISAITKNYRYLRRRKEVLKYVARMTKDEQTADRFLRLPERIAWVLAKTYVVSGDDYETADDIALQQIREMIEEFQNPDYIRRAVEQKKRLSRGKRESTE